MLLAISTPVAITDSKTTLDTLIAVSTDS